jgi:hypothetical protein
VNAVINIDEKSLINYKSIRHLHSKVGLPKTHVDVKKVTKSRLVSIFKAKGKVRYHKWHLNIAVLTSRKALPEVRL